MCLTHFITSVFKYSVHSVFVCNLNNNLDAERKVICVFFFFYNIMLVGLVHIGKYNISKSIFL